MDQGKPENEVPPPTGPESTTLSLRMTKADRQRIKDRALAADVDESRMARRMLAYADQHMPDTWVPPRGER